MPLFIPPLQINRSSTLAKELCLALFPATFPLGAVDIQCAGGGTAQIATAGAIRTRAWQKYRDWTFLGSTFGTADGDKFQLTNSGIPAIATGDRSTGKGPGDWSGMIICNLPNTAFYGRVVQHGNNGGGLNGDFLFMSNFSGASNTTVAGTATVLDYAGGIVGSCDTPANAVDGNVHVWSWGRVAGSTYKLYKDGVDVSTNRTGVSGNIGSNSTNTTGLCLSGLYGINESHGMNCTFSCFLAWNRTLTAQEHWLLANKLDSLFVPAYQGIFQ